MSVAQRDPVPSTLAPESRPMNIQSRSLVRSVITRPSLVSTSVSKNTLGIPDTYQRSDHNTAAFGKNVRGQHLSRDQVHSSSPYQRLWCVSRLTVDLSGNYDTMR